MTFWEATRFCSNSWNGFGLGALTSIQTLSEYTFLVNNVSSTIPPMTDFWIGLTWRGDSSNYRPQCSFNWNDKSTPTTRYQPEIFERIEVGSVGVFLPKSEFIDPESRAAVLDPLRCESGKDLECWTQRTGAGRWRLAGQVAGISLSLESSSAGSLCKKRDGIRLGFVCRRDLSVLKLRDWGIYGMAFCLWGVFGVVLVISGILWLFVACCVALRCPKVANGGSYPMGSCACLKLNLKTVTVKDSVRKVPGRFGVKLLDHRDWEKRKGEEIVKEVRDVELVDVDIDWDSDSEKRYGYLDSQEFDLQRHTIVSHYCCRWAGVWSAVWCISLTLFSLASSILSFIVAHVGWSSPNYVFLSVALAGIALSICILPSVFGLYYLRMTWTEWNCRGECPMNVLHAVRYILPSLLCPPYGIYFLLCYVFGTRFCQFPPERKIREELVKEQLDDALDLRKRRKRNKVFGVHLAVILQKTRLTHFEEVLLISMGEVRQLRPFSDSCSHEQKQIQEFMNWSETPDKCDVLVEPPDMQLNPIPYFCAMEREGALELLFEQHIEGEYDRLRSYLQSKFDPFQRILREREDKEKMKKNGDCVASDDSSSVL